MINIDFKIILDSGDSSIKKEIPIQDLDPQKLYDWLCIADNYLKGGYCISVVNEAWNGYWDDDTKSYIYYIDHIDGAFSFLKAMNYFNSSHATVGDSKTDIWQCDGSAMELSLIGEDAILLKDEVFECEEMVTSVPYFSFLFQEATEAFIKSICQVIDLCPKDNEMKAGLSYLVEEAKKHSIRLDPEKSAIFKQLSGKLF